VGEFDEASHVIFRPTSFLVVKKNFSGWEAGDGFSVVLLKSVVGKFETFLGAVGPQVTVHAAVNGLAILVQSSSPGVVPETAPIVLFLEADNFGDFDSGFLQLDKVVKSRTARRTAADQADSHFTSWCHGCIIVDDGQN